MRDIWSNLSRHCKMIFCTDFHFKLNQDRTKHQAFRISNIHHEFSIVLQKHHTIFVLSLYLCWKLRLRVLSAWIFLQKTLAYFDCNDLVIFATASGPQLKLMMGFHSTLLRQQRLWGVMDDDKRVHWKSYIYIHLKIGKILFISLPGMISKEIFCFHTKYLQI